MSVRNAFNNLIAAIEAGTATTRFAGTVSWRNLNVNDPEELFTVPNPTRCFHVSEAVSTESDGRMSQPSNPEGVYESRVVSIAYQLSDDPNENTIVIDEDERYLTDRLQHPGTYGSAVSDRSVVDAIRDDDENPDAGAVSLLQLTVRQKYRPTFSL